MIRPTKIILNSLSIFHQKYCVMRLLIKQVQYENLWNKFIFLSFCIQWRIKLLEPSTWDI